MLIVNCISSLSNFILIKTIVQAPMKHLNVIGITDNLIVQQTNYLFFKKNSDFESIYSIIRSSEESNL